MYDESNYQNISLKQKDPFLKLSEFKVNKLLNKNPKRIGYLTNFKNHIKCSPSHSRAVN